MSGVNKAELRAHFKRIRDSMTAEEKDNIENKVFECCVNSDIFRQSKDILIYVSGGIEIGTRKLMGHVLKDAESGLKRLLCPKCVKGTNIMHFYVIGSMEELESGSFGILEPKACCERVDDPIDPLCIVPALSFDSKGYRLGFGKGFYDRFLADFNGISVGLCCESCMTDGELPRDAHDICVDYIATECGWVKDPQHEYKRKGDSRNER